MIFARALRLTVAAAFSMFFLGLHARPTSSEAAISNSRGLSGNGDAADDDSVDYSKREVMIPMRDGARLHTVILIPRGVPHAPMLLTRTPYNAVRRTSGGNPARLSTSVPRFESNAVDAGYIIVFQDVRGMYASEGDYVMMRPLKGPLNHTEVDHATDAYDTIDWLIRHVPESNGRVGTIGSSYEGFTTLMSTVHPHPALKVAVALAPYVDGWVGDDWFHNGAFRQGVVLEYLYMQDAVPPRWGSRWSRYRDEYDHFLRMGSAGAMAAAYGLGSSKMWRALSEHPAYDNFWRQQAVDKLLERQPLSVPLLIVCGLFDPEDIYGGLALFRSLAPRDPEGQLVHLVLGPWDHAQGRDDGRGIGAIQFKGQTAAWARRTIMQRLLDYYLKDGTKPDAPRALVYETGINQWRRYSSWPPACPVGCAARSRRLYLLPGGRLGFNRPSDDKSPYDEYVSDPSKPVPYRERPTLEFTAPDSTWGSWLVDDQRCSATRPDVLVYETEPLDEPLRVAGEPIAQIDASTSGSDSDWVVKVIDVWPDEVPNHRRLGGYQQMLTADIIRGRYGVDASNPHPLTPNAVVHYRFRLPDVSHTFLPGHRIMVQVQSSWFPLYDRNPQTFTPNIMFAPPQIYVKATQRIWHTTKHASAIELPTLGSATALTN